MGEPLDPITMPTPGDAGCPPPGEVTLTRKDAVQQARPRRARGEQGRVTGTAVTTELPPLRQQPWKARAKRRDLEISLLLGGSEEESRRKAVM